MRRRKLLLGTPHGTGFRNVELAQPPLQNAAPFEIGAVKPATQRVEDQELDAREYFGRDRLVAQAGDELRHAASVGIIGCRLGRRWRVHFLADCEMLNGSPLPLFVRQSAQSTALCPVRSGARGCPVNQRMPTVQM